MRHWSQLATRNWRAKRVRTAGAVLAIALGTGAVVWVTCCYESVRQTVMGWAGSYVGNSHISIESAWGKYDTLPQRVVPKIEQVENVKYVAALLVQRLRAATVRHSELEPDGTVPPGIEPSMDDLDVYGIDLDHEFQIRRWPDSLIAGRMLTPDDKYACVLESAVAEEQGIGLGDRLLLWRGGEEQAAPATLEVVGLIQRRRVARFLKGVALVRLPVLQEICLKYAMVNSIDVVLEDHTQHALRVTAERIYALVRGIAPSVQVRSAEARQAQIQAAMDQQRVVLVLMSCVAMLTALFIILSTLSMGMVERIRQLGLLRCVGTTRAQLAGLTLAEILPLGLLGIVLGVPVGLGLTALTVYAVPQYVGQFTISPSGIWLALIAGAATTLVAALLPAVSTASISPLEGTRPRARQAGFGVLLAALIIGVLAITAQSYVVEYRVQRDLQFVNWSATSVVLLYVAYALAAPAIVWLVSLFFVPVTAALVRVRVRLLQDQVGRAVWRSAGIVCGLMVGLSLIVSLLVFNASFRAGWQFPKQFPEAYVWSFDQVPGDARPAIAYVPGIKQYTVANSPNVQVEEQALPGAPMLRSISFFLGIDPDSFLDMVKLKFLEGDEDTARALLKQGGHVIVAADFARARRKGVQEVVDERGNVVVSNKVRILLNNRWSTFTVAGVIDSPALDIAASYFQVQSESRVAATGSVIGTNDDLKRIFGLDGFKLILLNFDLPPAPVPPDWPPPRGTPAARGLDAKYYNPRVPLERRWQNYREEYLVLQALVRKLNAPQAFYGTARELKDEIDAELNRMTYLLTAVPAMALLVAAIGVANLMTANVASRTKQVAIMRAVGATRGFVLRLVVGEALVLGLLGSFLGLGLGLHLAWNTTTMMQRMWGYAVPFQVPWPFVLISITVTVTLCIIAGILPARHASRTNIIDALHVA